MDLMIKVYLERAKNEHILADMLKRISENKAAQTYLELEEDITFYSGAIAHAYYSIFYAAKAILLAKGVKTEMPDVHKKTYEELKKNLVDSGILDLKLLEIYQRIAVRADELLEIFKSEKWKRGHFTYQTIPQANKEPAEQSIQNALTFIKNIKLVLEK